MNARQLPLKYPMINSSMDSSHLLSVVGLSQNNTHWLNNQYSQIYCGYGSDVLDIDFLSPEYPRGQFPHLLIQEADTDPDVAVEQIIKSIQENMYVELSIDEFFIEGKHYYNKAHFNRHFLIYGYDLQNNSISLAGPDYNKIFNHHSLSFTQLINSLRYHLSHKQSIRFICLDDRFEVGFDLLALIKDLHDYLNSNHMKRSLEPYVKEDTLVWGIGVYTQLKIYLDKLSQGEIFYCIRPFHLLWEHKKCMLNRIKYLIQLGYSIPESVRVGYEDLYETALILRNILVKYHLSNDGNLIRIASNLLEKVASEEQILLSRLLLELEQR